jgi:hypothetical protein
LDKTIVTALLVVAGVVSAVVFFNALFPVITQSSASMASMERRMDDRLQTQIQFIHGSLSGTDVVLWVKNIGSVRILSPQSSDLFFGPQGNFVRLPYGTGTPHWEYVVENDTEWNPTTTIKITVVGFSPLSSGRYFAKLVLTNGISDEYYLSW